MEPAACTARRGAQQVVLAVRSSHIQRPAAVPIAAVQHQTAVAGHDLSAGQAAVVLGIVRIAAVQGHDRYVNSAFSTVAIGAFRVDVAEACEGCLDGVIHK